MTEDCELCLMAKSKYKFLITSCVGCDTKCSEFHPMVVSFEHKTEFNEGEKQFIQQLFPGRLIYWEKRTVLNHAHCHVACKKGTNCGAKKSQGY